MAEFCHKNRQIDFVALVRAHDRHVRGILRLQGVRGSDIDDLSQEVWLVAFMHDDKMLASQGTVRGWLSEVARRRALHVLGASWNRRHVFVEGEDLEELAIDSGTRIEAAAILSELLLRLPERYTDLMRLRALEWETHEIAELLGDAWSTVDSKWRRVCQELAGE